MNYAKLETTNINAAISALCADIWENLQQQAARIVYKERRLWEELVFCILSSQVNFELSHAVTQKIKDSGILKSKTTDHYFHERLGAILREPVTLSGRSVKYRFPNSKAKQVTATRNNIYGSGLRLVELFRKNHEPLSLRKTLINLAPGLGMKQASMYLRNVNCTFDLAVIDAQILRYMQLMGLGVDHSSGITQNQYLAKENLLIKHTQGFGYPVGCVDYAIWIVMRVARKAGYL